MSFQNCDLRRQTASCDHQTLGQKPSQRDRALEGGKRPKEWTSGRQTGCWGDLQQGAAAADGPLGDRALCSAMPPHPGTLVPLPLSYI